MTTTLIDLDRRFDAHVAGCKDNERALSDKFLDVKREVENNTSRLGQVQRGLNDLGHRVNGLSLDMSRFGSRMEILETDSAVLKADVSELKTGMSRVLEILENR